MYRWNSFLLPLLYLLICFLGFILIVNLGWDLVWTSLKFPSMTPVFADMRTIQGAIISHAEGYNPQYFNPGDPWNRSMNYPSVWLHLARLLKLERENRFVLFCTGIVTAFILVNSDLLRKFPSIYLLLSLLSSSVLLAIERGNNDMVIYFLIVTMAITSHSFLVSGLALITAVLFKLYPLIGLGMYYLRGEIKHFFLLVVVLGILLLPFYSEIPAIRAGNTADGIISYGISTINHLKNMILDNTIKGEINPTFWLLIALFVIGIMAFLIRSPLLIRPDQIVDQNSSTAVNLFYLGALIYTGTFISASNWDYRLMFLPLCIPYLTHPYIGRQGKAFCLVILLAMNTIWLQYFFPSFTAVTLLSKMMVFIIFTIMLGIFFFTSTLQLIHPLNSKRS